MQNIDMRVHQIGFGSSEGMSLHNHESTGLFEFHFILSGEGCFQNGKNQPRVSPGTLVVSRPEDLHQGIADSKSRLHFYWLLMDTQGDTEGLLAPILAAAEPEGRLEPGMGQSLSFEDIRHRHAGDAGSRRSADLRLQLFLSDLAALGHRETRPRSPYVAEALRLMQKSIHGDLDLGGLSRHLGISPEYFVRLFKAEVGVPPMRYFMGLRIDAAKYRLIASNEGLQGMARDLGFTDGFHLSHQFKLVTGMSPQRFRENGGMRTQQA